MYVFIFTMTRLDLWQFAKGSNHLMLSACGYAMLLVADASACCYVYDTIR